MSTDAATAPPARFTIGASASCTDGPCGSVTRVVIDPIDRVLTHLVVEPRHRIGLGRLVPLDLLDPRSEDVRLNCTVAQFGQLDGAEETHFLPGTETSLGYRPGEAIFWPHYGLAGEPWGGMRGGAEVGPDGISDSLPAGEVGIRRGDPVHATDGDIGRVHGLVVTSPEHRITHVLLQEGHLLGRKEVAIPIGAVTAVTGGIELNLTKQQVQDLPSIEVVAPQA